MGHDIYAYARVGWSIKEVVRMRRGARDAHRAAIYELLDAKLFYADESGFGTGCFFTTGRLSDALQAAQLRPELDREAKFLSACLAVCDARRLNGLEIEFC